MDGGFGRQQEDIITAVRNLAPLVAEHRATFDLDRRLPKPVIDALVTADLFRLWVPAKFGGAELSPRALIDVIEEASVIDASLGWILTNATTSGRLAGYLPDAVASAWFEHADMFVAGSTGALGVARPVPGGLLVSGRWPFASGVHSARRITGLCKLEGAPEDPRQNLLFCHFDAGDIRIIDTWHASGLRGTGSCDFVVEEVFVPQDHAQGFVDPLPFQPGMLYRLPILSLFPFSVALVPLGIARGAVEDFVGIATRTRGGTSAPLRERETIQNEVARAEALRRSARALIIDSLADLEAAMDTSGERLIRARAFFRVALSHGAESCLHAVEIVAAAAGTASILEASPLERRVRDIQAAVKHVAMAPHNFVVGGRVLLGIDPGTVRF